MPFTRFATKIALAAAATLTLSSGAFALMVGDQDVSDEDLPAVSRYCAELAKSDADSNAVTAPANDAAEAKPGGAQTSAANAPASSADAAAKATEDNGDTKAGDAIDFSAITLKQCQDAHLV